MKETLVLGVLALAFAIYYGVVTFFGGGIGKSRR